MPTIIIDGTQIDFPNTAASPDWSQGVIQFANATAAALSGLIGTGDISKQFYPLSSSNNPSSDTLITGLAFSTAAVRAGFIRYSVYRQTSGIGATSVYEAGEMTVVYNANNPTNQKWELQREYVGNAQITFTVDDSGQFYFTTTAISGTSQIGQLDFVAQALVQ